MQYRKEADLLDFYKRCTYFEMWPNDPAFKRRGDYDLFEVAKLIPCNQVSIAPRPRPIKTPC